jgi:ABC-2 type transport system ATP-binding protein
VGAILADKLRLPETNNGCRALKADGQKDRMTQPSDRLRVHWPADRAVVPTTRAHNDRLVGQHVCGLRMTYVVPEREAGVVAALRSLAHRRVWMVAAVDGITFDVQPGEVVGFLGPNGAGKTTTLKVLSGLLYPTAGDVSVLGHVPWRREKAFPRQITLVMGQRNRLNWDIPVIDSLELNRAIYRLPHAEYRRTLDELTALLELGPLLRKPVRTLTLGERMKLEM